MDYTGLTCPVCGQAFRTDDDIVVCPECGAPYHRSCYTQTGRCLYADKHGTSQAWRPPAKKQEEAAESQNAASSQTKKCPRCGKPNGKNALFCDHCGLSLDGQNPPVAGPAGFGGQQRGGQQPPFGFPGQMPIPFPFDPLGGVPPQEPINGVPAHEMAKLVQNNTAYYLPVFAGIQRFRRSRFNFSAFLFSGGWMLYRKMYRLGGIFTGLMLALYIASLYISTTQTDPLMVRLFGEIGVNLKEVYPTMAQYNEFVQLLMQQPPEDILCVLLPSVLSLAQLGVMLFSGFRANRLYCSHCAEKIQRMHQIAPVQADFEVQLQEKGGVNTSLAISLLICFMVLFYLPAFL